MLHIIMNIAPHWFNEAVFINKLTCENAPGTPTNVYVANSDAKSCFKTIKRTSKMRLGKGIYEHKNCYIVVYLQEIY